MKVWIDLSNSPHPLLFAPISRRLEELGHEVLVTARDNAQTVELARERWPTVDVVGGPSPGARPAKAAVLADRVRSLRKWAKAHSPDVALSHNSYAQIVAARMLRIPAVTAMDFEHQPANHLAFRLARSILVPELIPEDALRRQGASRRKLHRYPGLKEELCLADFKPDPHVLTELGIHRNDDTAVAVIRTPPTRAVYHRFENPLLVDVLKAVGRQPKVRAVILPRYPEQCRAIADLHLSNCVVPERAVDSRSLMYGADVVIGAGGTMTREAALMGVPTFTIYAGDPPAVDSWLECHGALTRLKSPSQVASIQRRTSEPQSLDHLHDRSSRILQAFIDVTCETGAAR